MDLTVAGTGALQKTEVVATDTATRLQIDAVQNGRVIASCDCPYLMIRREEAGLSSKRGMPCARRGRVIRHGRSEDR